MTPERRTHTLTNDGPEGDLRSNRRKWPAFQTKKRLNFGDLKGGVIQIETWDDDVVELAKKAFM
jgi:hypothetical protein